MWVVFSFLSASEKGFRNRGMKRNAFVSFLFNGEEISVCTFSFIFNWAGFCFGFLFTFFISVESMDCGIWDYKESISVFIIWGLTNAMFNNFLFTCLVWFYFFWKICVWVGQKVFHSFIKFISLRKTLTKRERRITLPTRKTMNKY